MRRSWAFRIEEFEFVVSHNLRARLTFIQKEFGQHTKLYFAYSTPSEYVERD
jgi:hypothetical protein